ncbi:uncharacterized protein LOC123310703 isoform X2 [Coccinella septempunctata]|uniref:uncharacterized protein LOC123310703 isoform X2 n=1 Tax=Coccinella septempunctata TaxID=41139 RepID=UPI001D079749|nr:uncharacterized protein LOC123310703 isoform X2 [Coccinella septempunctata]
MLSMPTFLLSSVLIYSFTSAVPVISKGYVLLPVGDLKESGGRQGIIAGWIQNSQFFPIEVNVPQIISNVTSGVQGIGQNVGQGLQTVGQNVGQGLQNWASSLGQRFPIINRLPIIGSQINQNQMTTQKFLVMMPVKKGDVNSLPDTEELFTYP